jgi:starvation-inducible DNA-binding protein
VVELLCARLADAIDLGTQIKQAHWTVKGSNFIALHKLFDDIHEDVEDYTDTIAERAVQLGGQTAGTVRATAGKTTLPEYPLTITAWKDHVAAMSTVLAAFGKSARQGIDRANEAGDADTADLFTNVSRGIDKWLWMVESHLQEK